MELVNNPPSINLPAHGESLLEYLEEVGIAYNVNKNLVRGLSYYTRTVFEVYTINTEGLPTQVASGGRYDYLAKQLGGKKDVPAVGFSMGVDRVVESGWYKKLGVRLSSKLSLPSHKIAL